MHVVVDVREPLSPEDAIQIQNDFARGVRLGEQFKNVAGVDVAYSRDDERAYVAAVVLSTTNWKIVHEQKVMLPVKMRYESGMLGFREGPLMLEALTRLAVTPDLILVDGNGLAHPRRFGLACHVGISLDHPTVGVAKTWPAGCKQTGAVVARQPRGGKAALLLETGGHKVGYELFTQPNTNPIYVSPGHRVSVEEAASFALRAAPHFRKPEPLRMADQVANAFRDAEEGT
jgi:deoxyribonuclease V